MASGFKMSNISDILLFMSESDDDSDSAADSDILRDAEEEVLHSSELDIYDKRNGFSRNDSSWDDDELGPSSHFTTTNWVSKANMAAEVSDEGKGESGRDDGGSDSDIKSDGECLPPKRAKCTKKGKGKLERKWCADIVFTPEPLKSFDDRARGVQPEYQLREDVPEANYFTIFLMGK